MIHKILLSAVSTFLTSLAIMALTTQQSYAQLPSCELIDEEQLYWDALSQTVSLRTELFTPEDSFPSARLTLILEDGEKVDLGEGQKYIDDAEDEVLQDCQKHLKIAKSDTLASLSVNRRFPTLESLWAYSAMGQDCMDANNLPEAGPSAYCLEANQMHHAFTEGLAHSGIDRERYIRIRDGNAPLIVVKRSTYYSETLVYDAESKSAFVIMAQGC